MSARARGSKGARKEFEIVFTLTFDRVVRKVEPRLLEEISDTIEKLKVIENHQHLKVHKLHGKLKQYYAASVDYRHRIIFRYIDTTRILLVDFGDHSVYDI